MSVVKINVLTVPENMRDELERRIAGRAGLVENAEGFEGFELLRPVEGSDRYLVYTRWRSEEDFQNWMNSAAFQHGHKAHNSQGPVSNQSALWQFDVVQHEDAPAS